jgi:hypothetical protein
MVLKFSLHFWFLMISPSIFAKPDMDQEKYRMPFK